MKHSFLTSTSAVFLAAAIFVIGCNKETSLSTAITEEAIALTNSTQEDALADITFNDVFEQTMGTSDDYSIPEIGLGGAGDGVSIGLDSVDNKCFVVTISPRDRGVFPKTVTINFGATECVGKDGKRRKGKIITVYSAPMVTPGATATTRFDGFFVNGVKIEGTHIAKNNSTSNVRIFTRTVENGKLTYPSGDYVEWRATHTNTQVAGLGTPDFPFDDEFTITGGAKGVNKRDGKVIEWSRLIAEPLHKAFKCRWFDAGVVKITRNDKHSLFNYGNGNCDNKATITIEGVSKEITL